MASLGDVSRFLRQRRAVGKPITAEDRRAAWNAYYDTQAVKSLERSRIANQRDQFNQTMSFNKEQAAITNARLQEQSEAAAKANTIRGITELGTLGYKAYNSDLGKTALYKAKTLMGMDATGLPELAGGSSPIGGALTGSPTSVNLLGASSTGAQGLSTQAVTNLAPAATEGVSGTGLSALAEGSSPMSAAPVSSTGITGAALNFAAPALAGYGVGQYAAGRTMESETMQDFWETGTFGLAHAKKDAARLSGAAAGAAAGALVGGPVGAVIGGIIGGVGKEVVDEVGDFAHSAFNKVTDVFGTWICSETKKTIGMTKEEWKIIGDFRHYARDIHSDWLEWYVDIGTELIEAINGDERFYTELKEDMLDPVMLLTENGYPEIAYDVYKKEVINLVKAFKPELGESAPEVI